MRFQKKKTLHYYASRNELKWSGLLGRNNQQEVRSRHSRPGLAATNFQVTKAKAGDMSDFMAKTFMGSTCTAICAEDGAMGITCIRCCCEATPMQRGSLQPSHA